MKTKAEFTKPVRNGGKAASGDLTPLMRQYFEIKEQHPDHVLFFRCGDFYEMFFDDARTCAETLGITLTSRGTDTSGQPVPLAGIPYHSVEGYLARMIRAGFRVAICEQMENPKQAKGVVRREVVRVVTPGTILEENLLSDKANNYLAAVAMEEKSGIVGLSALDFSTGEYLAAEFRGADAASRCLSELARLGPSELVIPADQREQLSSVNGVNLLSREDSISQNTELRSSGSLPVVTVDSAATSPYAARQTLLRHFGVRDLAGFGIEEFSAGLQAAAAILQYLDETQQHQLVHVNELRVHNPENFMMLDAVTQRSLELVTNLTDATRRHTLFEVLDHTATGLGGRRLRSWILQPLRDPKAINQRLDAVEALVSRHDARERAFQVLRGVSDLERIVSRASCRTANARDLLALRSSLLCIPELKSLAPLLQDTGTGLLGQLFDRMNPLDDLTAILSTAISDSPPVSVREGGMIRPGFSPELDELRSLATDSKSWIAALRQREAEQTGIANLKIGFNRVFGYYLEVSNSHSAKVPPTWVRKQTLAGAERFVTPELKEKEEVILHADERAKELEWQLFEKLREAVCESARAIQETARALASFDALLSLARAACSGRYVRPQMLDESPVGELTIREGRHPVLERIRSEQSFVPNDTRLNCTEEQVLLITGPNMAGKSTFIRQVALITLMAHMGSFVPAVEASMGPVDRIFTRVGAMDHLAKGQSTFLVEMSETANILNNTTDRSLVILDEIGRGTSTYDGLSIAWSVVEYLHNTPGRKPKTLFATHYHELAGLEGVLSRVRNYNVAVHEEEGRVAFLYRILRGHTDHSYGIYAAQVAGLPRAAVDRARRILSDLEHGNAIHVQPGGGSEKPIQIEERTVQLTFFDAADHPVLEKLRKTDINALTPLQALSLLAELKVDASG